MPVTFSALSRLMQPLTTVVLRPDSIALRGAMGGESVAIDRVPGQDPYAQAQSAATAFAALMARRRSKPERFTLLASDYWLRALVAPLHGQSLADKETAVLVDRSLEQAFGATGNAWVSRWLIQPDGSVLAAAWPLPLAQLVAGRAQGTPRAERAAPLSMEVFGSLRMGRRVGWAILVDGPMVTVARLHGRNWGCWRVGQFGDSESARALDWFLRLVAQTSDACGDVWLGVCGAPKPVAHPLGAGLRDAGWTVREIGDLP